MLNSTNPALRDEKIWNASIAGAENEVASVQGVVNKTGMLAVVAILGGMLGISLVEKQPGLVIPMAILGFIATLVVYFVIMFKPMRAKYTAWIYSLVQGAFLGTIAYSLEGLLESMGYEAMGGLALQAFVITMSVLVSMLGLYYCRILQPTKMFVSVVSVLTLGVFIAYLMLFIFGLFGVTIPWIGIGSALEGGQTALIGLGINLFILILASLWLIIDFGLVEQHVNNGAPKQMEWFCGFILMVTLVWIYLEALKLCFRLAILFGKKR
tara:strand:+ start:508 stop:1311 length:804 start_codon:yes stop_codon:yes gene_type:complete